MSSHSLKCRKNTESKNPKFAKKKNRSAVCFLNNKKQVDY